MVNRITWRVAADLYILTLNSFLPARIKWNVSLKEVAKKNWPLNQRVEVCREAISEPNGWCLINTILCISIVCSRWTLTLKGWWTVVKGLQAVSWCQGLLPKHSDGYRGLKVSCRRNHRMNRIGEKRETKASSKKSLKIDSRSGRMEDRVSC